MPVPFSKVFEDETKTTVPDIKELIFNYCKRSLTGVIRLISGDSESLYLLLKRGIVINSYIVTPEVSKPLSSESWKAWIDSTGGAYIKFFSISPQGLLICKLLLENNVGKNHSFTSADELGKYLESQRMIPELFLVNLEWEDSIGAILFLGLSEAPYSLFSSPKTLYDQSGIAPGILHSQYSNSTVRAFGYNNSVGAWQEFLLRRAFADICERTLSRFQVIAGRALVDSLVRLVLVFASRRDLDISMSSRKVVDSEVFSSPEVAANAYRLLLTEMLLHFSGITGSRLLASSLKEIVMSLPLQEREIIESFALLSEGYVYDRKT